MVITISQRGLKKTKPRPSWGLVD